MNSLPPNNVSTIVFFIPVAPPILGDVTPSFLMHKEGETVELFCEATASPDPVVVWSKDDREITSDDRITVDENRVQIRDLVRTDGGAYSCVFKNTVGHVMHTIKLVIEGERGSIWLFEFVVRQLGLLHRKTTTYAHQNQLLGFHRGLDTRRRDRK